MRTDGPSRKRNKCEVHAIVTLLLFLDNLRVASSNSFHPPLTEKSKLENPLTPMFFLHGNFSAGVVRNKTEK
jgi:hypothetical protein